MKIKSTQTNLLIGEVWLPINEEVEVEQAVADIALSSEGVILVNQDLLSVKGKQKEVVTFDKEK